MSGEPTKEESSGRRGEGRAARRVTQPQRRFEPADLAALPRDDRRKLVQLLLTEGGAQLTEFQSPAAYDELVMTVTPLWDERSVRVRIATREVDQSDIDRLADRVAETGDAEGVMIAPCGVAATLSLPPAVALVSPGELISRFERSALVAWPNRRPVPAYDRVAAQRSLEHDAALLDPVGLRWLPTAALNELPTELTVTGLAPQDLLERLAFRMFTSVFRFGGTRYGEAARGERVPDAVLTWPAANEHRLAALLDCKASADGYTMESDHYLRFQQYVERMRPQLDGEGYQLGYIVVLSSDFAGRPGGRHPFHGRAKGLRDESGVELVYLRAVDLARAAVAVEGAELMPRARERLDWRTTFSAGLVEAGHVETMLGRGS